MILSTRLQVPRQLPRVVRGISTLPNNSNIKVFPHPTQPSSYLLTLLSRDPPTPSLAIGTTTAIPPTPRSFQHNPKFLTVLDEVLTKHAINDPGLKAQAQAFASPGGFTFIHNPGKKDRGAGGGGGASAEGGAGGAGVGGWVHLSDARNPPDFGRIAWPEDIFGSVEVNGKGKIVGNYQPSGTYRIVTNQGILGLSPFLHERLLARLREEESKEQK
ncbi:uncharacterized protein PODANS_2_550 [Podospora anserina S mat+]|uniref:Podospora anserina S mat+ genomic DNA chromosome 2, supercontig 2 n=1 Tax=Podospora anserina (strain S / ATCC MYA-4624 / DSM 980 / FGSC 10383) TaxID=515849 RepID=B2B499_PODAN|nr:uncharacterized protein PODANS_2_550 [Podospora anserina S mat+]CAP72623.1 unnamed protein product [Podospora anserina S mat+]CDP25018.1 Putative protein of unknown function [Podospora anserina S mat+]